MISVTFQRLCDVCGESSDVGRVSLVADTRPEGSTARPEVTLPGDTQGPRDIHRALLVVPLHHIGWPTRHKDAIIMAHTPHLGTGADKRKTKSHSNQCLEDTSPTKRRTILSHQCPLVPVLGRYQSYGNNRRQYSKGRIMTKNTTIFPGYNTDQTNCNIYKSPNRMQYSIFITSKTEQTAIFMINFQTECNVLRLNNFHIDLENVP